MAIFRNEAGKRFVRNEPEPLKAQATRDQAAILGLVRSNNVRSLLVASDNYEEQATGAGPGVRGVLLPKGTAKDLLPAQASSFGPMALGDIDGDGDLDLFVGGRAVASHYPEPASSLLLRWQNGAFEVDPESKAALTNVGLVNGAVFTDLDGDGSPELVLACDAGSIRVFRAAAGRLAELTRELGFEKYRGFWTGVTAGDLDGDGRLDIVASNLGPKFQIRKVQAAENPLRRPRSKRRASKLLKALSTNSAVADLPLQSFHIVSAALPFLKERFPEVQSYARSDFGRRFTARLCHRRARWNSIGSTRLCF